MQWITYVSIIASTLFVLETSSKPMPHSSEESRLEMREENRKEGDLDMETQDQVAILKQINRVNEDGSYTFGYEAADGSFKIETRDVNGNVKGMFGFINEDGELKRVSYSASNGTGFQATGSFNVPPLPGTSLSSEEENGNTPSKLLDQRLFQSRQTGSTKINLLPSSTTSYDDRTTELIPIPRLPIYIFSTTPTSSDVTTTARPAVIQHIPKARPTSGTSTTEATESEDASRKTTFNDFFPKKSSNANYVTRNSNEATTEASEDEITQRPSVIQVIRPRGGSLKKVIVTKRPLIETTTSKPDTTTEFFSREYLDTLKEKEPETTNDVRRQLDFDNYSTTPENVNLVTSGTEDNPDVYGGTPTPRPYTTVAYKALFTQIPPHQRILQNSYIQNQNQYLSAAFPTAIPPGFNGQLPGPVSPNQGRLLPSPPVVSDNMGNQPSNFNSRPDTQRTTDQPSRNYPIPSQHLNRVFPNPAPLQPTYTNPPPVQPHYANPGSFQIPFPYQRDPYNQPLYIPPGLLESLIRMLIAVQQRQLAFHQPSLPPVNSKNFAPELFDPYSQNALPYPNYSQSPYPYPSQYVSRSSQDPRLVDPRAMPYYNNPYQSTPVYSDSRANNFQAPIPFRSPIVDPYGKLPYHPNQDALLLRPLFSGRHLPQIQNSPGAVERSVPYDSTTSSTTSNPRIGSVRNVQILNPISEDGEESGKYQRDIKS